ncbi:MAG: hypothetical protein HND48_21135 [Chloroflexi bacterium]|nr:hypothetical protein [Chloroflexota bacterium]
MSQAEIAEVMQTSVGTVKSRLFHAKRSLRGMVRPDVLLALSADSQPQPVDDRLEPMLAGG